MLSALRIHSSNWEPVSANLATICAKTQACPALFTLVWTYYLAPRALIFCETARRPLHLIQLPLSNLLGINYVSRHDACVSVEGGFHGQELPELLGLEPNDWTIETKMTFLGAYRLVAVRKNR